MSMGENKTLFRAWLQLLKTYEAKELLQMSYRATCLK
jgi:hypothetical protein